MNILFRIYRILIQILCVPIFLQEFLDSKTGKEYGVGFGSKCSLIAKMIWNNTRIVSGSTFLEHVNMAVTLLKTPKSMPGVVVECGTYKGVSAANISLICALVGRRLQIFDSFEGLPEPTESDKAHTLIGIQEIHTYEKGTWCGRLEEVQDNIRRYGNIGVCDFHKGYFDETLPSFKQPCAQIFVDVDYRSSLESCVKYLWPLLQDGGYFFTHEAGHVEIYSLFFSEDYWKTNFHSNPPGLVGAGTGIGIKILNGPYFTSSLAFTVKNPSKENYSSVPQVGGMRLNLGSSIKLTDSAISAQGSPKAPARKP
jgi:O-methyltransferase